MTAPVAEPPPIVAPAATPDPHVAVNSVTVELLGNGLLYSIDYERLFPRWHLGLRVGASYFAYGISSSVGAGDLKIATFPIIASYYFGIGATPHKVQVGLGTTLLWVNASTDATGTEYGDSGFAVAATAVVGYRYLPLHGGFTFGAGFTPLWRSGKGLLAWGGANAGYAF